MGLTAWGFQIPAALLLLTTAQSGSFEQPKSRERIKIAYIGRAQSFQGPGGGAMATAKPRYTILVVRIEGISRKEFNRTSKKVIEADGNAYEAAAQTVSRLKTTRPRPLVIDPFIVMVFAVPENVVKNLRLVLGDFCSVPFGAPRGVAASLSHQDIVDEALHPEGSKGGNGAGIAKPADRP